MVVTSGWSVATDNPGISTDVLVDWLVQWCDTDNPALSVYVLICWLVQWCPGQSWDIYGCFSILAGPVVPWTIMGFYVLAGPVVPWTILGYLWMF